MSLMGVALLFVCATSTAWRDIASVAVVWSRYGLSGCFCVLSRCVVG